MEINRLTITTESRILGDEYVRFGGEYIETCFHKGKKGALCLAIGAVVCLAVVRQLKHVVLRHVRLNDEDVGVVAALHHFCCDVFRRRFAKVVDVWLKGESHHCDCWLAVVFELEAEHCVLHFLGTPECLVVVDFARFCNQLALNGEVGCEEVWVDGNAVSAHSASRLQDVDARMLVGECDELPHVDARLVADERQLVGEGNLHVARGVFGEFAHFRRLAVCAVERALHELAVECNCLVGRRLVHTANHAVVVHQFVDYVARQHAFRAVCYMDFPLSSGRSSKMSFAILSVVPTGDVDSIT